MISEAERIRRLSEDVPNAQSLAREVAEHLSQLGDPDAGDATRMLEELTALSGALQNSAQPESCVVVSRLMCIAARCTEHLESLQRAVTYAAAHAWS